MADHASFASGLSTARRELLTCVIEGPSSYRQRASCELNQVLALRGNGRFVSHGPVVVEADDSRKV